MHPRRLPTCPAKTKRQDPSNPKPQETGDDPNLQSLPQNLPDTLQVAPASASANLKPSSDLRISSLHSGTIVNVLVAEGDLVKSGQILMEIQNTEMEIRHQEVLGELSVGQEKIKTADLAIRQAAANLELAKAEYERVEKLREKGAISQSEARLKKSAVESGSTQIATGRTGRESVGAGILSFAKARGIGRPAC